MFLFHGVSRADSAYLRLDYHREHPIHRLEAHLHPSEDTAGATRRDHRRISAGGTDLGARAVAFIGVGAVVVFAAGIYRSAGRYLGTADRSLLQNLLHAV